MECWILDENFSGVSIVDSFESLIWTDRYREAGDFEIYAYPSDELIANAKDNYYLWNPKSDHMMIIEKQEITTDVEEGARFIITGSSLESILKRRIVWQQTTISGSLQNGIKKLLNENLISPATIVKPDGSMDNSRKIDNFVFVDSTDEVVTKLEHEEQYTGDNIYDIVTKLCETYDIGFQIIFNWTTKNFEFSLYKGADRSYAQETNPYVIFSPNYENIINSDYTHNITDYKNVTLVAGEGTGLDRKTTTYGSGSGLLRREVFTDARDISQKDDDGNELTDDQYKELLAQRGKTNLATYNIREGFEGEVEASKMFVYGTDFFLGDSVQVANEFGMTGTALVSEIVFSQDNDGEAVYPTFVSLNTEEANSDASETT